MSERAQRDPRLDEWRENIASQVRAIMAIQRLPQAELARSMGMNQSALSRRLLGKVSFSAEEVLWLADWMNRNIDEIMAAAKTQTNPCLSSSDPDAAVGLELWAVRGYELARILYGTAHDRLDDHICAA